MKKALLTKLMLLLCALIAGSSSVWAGEPDVTLDFTSQSNWDIPTDGTNKDEASFTDGTYTIKLCATTNYKLNSGYLLLGKKDSYLELPAFTFDVEKIEIVGTSGASTAVEQNIFVGENEVSAKTTGAKDVTNSYQIDGSYQAAGNVYRLVVLSAHNTQISKIFIYKKGAGVSTPSISGNQLFLTSTKVTITCGTEGATIQYSTDGSNWETYSDPFELTETKTVKAKATKDGLADSEETSKTFTKVTPMTVADALTVVDGLGDNKTIADQCVAGIVSQVDAFGSGAITYWISDDGTTTSQLEVYKGKGLYGANFTKQGDLMVGDEVTVYGTLKKYVKDSETIPEFDSGSQLLSYEAKGTPAPVITANNVTIESFATSGEIAYTIENPTGATLTAEVKTGDWISDLTVTADKVTFTATANNDDDKRTATITLKYDGAANKYVTITQKASFGVAKLPFAFDGGKDDIDGTETIPATPGLTQNGLGSYDYSPKLKFDGTGDYLLLQMTGTPEILNFDIKGNSFSGGTFKVQTSEDGATFTDLKTYTELGALSHESFALDGSVRFIKWIYTEKSGGNVALGRIGVNCEAVGVPEAGYATYCTPTAIDFEGTEITAYVVPNIVDNKVILQEITSAPANTPVVLKASSAGSYALNVPASAAELTTINLLRVSDGTKKGDYLYVLANKDNGVGFYKLKNSIAVPAGKCYLDLTVDAPEYLGFADDVTGINTLNVERGTLNGEVYNLAGQRVANPTKGLYIVNGKKVILK